MGKTKFICLLLLVAMILLSSCSPGTSNPGALAQINTAVVGTGTVLVPVVGLTVQATNAGVTFTVGQVINYRYTVTNIGVVPLAGPVTVIDNKTTVTCPNVNTVGNLDNSLDANESIICTSAYSITQADLTACSVINLSTASVGGFASNQVSTTVSCPAQTAGPIKLTKTANPLTYTQVGQVITYTYVIQNTSAAAIGPTQFTVSDNKLSALLNCGAPATTLAPQQTVTCSATYSIVQADLTAGRVTNSATASGGGNIVSAAATTIVTVATPSSGLTRGSTIPHKVVKDEWMIQIARCYGASFDAVRNANLQIVDPDVIEIDQILSIPNIGSNGNIYGPPCVGYHTVQSGDTWNSIAQRYNADVVVLQAANPGGMAVGTVLKIPLNSAGASTIPVTGGTPTPSPTLTPTHTFTPSPTSTPVTLTPTPITFTPTPPTGTLTAQQPIRISFPTGSNSTTLNGTVPAQGTIRYVLSAIPGQVLSVNLTAPVNEVGMTIIDPNGVTLKPLNTALTWTGPLTATGDYRIEVTSIVGTTNKDYTLNVGINISAATP